VKGDSPTAIHSDRGCHENGDAVRSGIRPRLMVVSGRFFPICCASARFLPLARLASGWTSVILRDSRGRARPASVAQSAEQLICNQQVVGSSPSASLHDNPPLVFWRNIVQIALRRASGASRARPDGKAGKGGFPSGQRGQTVNLMAMPSKVRILHSPLERMMSDE
jgi:hypothetical protein